MVPAKKDERERPAVQTTSPPTLMMPTRPRRIQRPHVKDVDALHLAEQLETLETRRLVHVRRHAAGLGAGAEQVPARLDVWGEKEEKKKRGQQQRRNHGSMGSAYRQETWTCGT
jgi:hypothetical protein